MPNAIIKLIRKVSVLSNRSKIPTSILPLNKIKSVVVIMDGMEPGAEDTAFDMMAFFEMVYVKATIIRIDNTNINSIGRLKNSVRYPGGKSVGRNEDLFISLLTDGTFVEEYEALCSPAKFKIGRSKFKSITYDILIQDPSGVHCNQRDAFKTISYFLRKIR